MVSKKSLLFLLLCISLFVFLCSYSLLLYHQKSILPRIGSKILELRRTQNEEMKEIASLTFQKHSPSVTPQDARPDSCNGCFKNDFTYLINNKICEGYTEVDVLVLILTGPNNFQQRQTIRETWGALCTKERHIACLFILGVTEDAKVMEKIKSENINHSDIIQLDFKESYGNLTYKTMSGFRWSRDFCSRAKFVMKADGDMYINLELIPILLKAVPTGKFYGGYCWGEQSPHRDKTSKWFVSLRSYPHKNFPPVCSGTAYILNSEFLIGLLNVSRNFPFFHLEDVFIGMAAKALNVRPMTLKGFSNIRTKFTPCSYRNEVMTSHYVDAKTLRQYWTKSRDCTLKSYKPEELYKVNKV
ncbi:beta-1,3-galactosyltransferase 5-like [Saccostrea cucullata]|uniref:beta-1,3-galactosyltransferase 5-like n=1 Tax=Saccostrea cuccullata TaxID=36930 RepID=UPI002ED5AE54